MKQHERSLWCLAGVLGMLAAPMTASAQVPAPSWVQQLGSSRDEQAQAVAVYGDSVYVVGTTTGQLGAEPPAGSRDVFVAKYNTAGTLQWVHQLGTSMDDRVTSVTADAYGNVVLAGYTWGSFEYYANAGGTDYFVAKYDAQGNRLFVRQHGTSMDDFATGVAAGNVGFFYISGYTGGSFQNGGNPGNYDIFMGLYDGAGNRYVLEQLGTPRSDVALSLAVTPNDEVYLVGYTWGSLDGTTTPTGTDLFLMKTNIVGVPQWVSQVNASGTDLANDVAVAADGTVYLTGYTDGTLDGNTSAGIYDVLLARYDAQGNRLWSRLLGSDGADYGQSLAVAADGTVNVTGITSGSLDGNTSMGGYDLYLSRYDSQGNKLGTHALGSGFSDHGRGVAVDAQGNAYVTGFTPAALGSNTSAGGYDAVLLRF